MAELLLLNPRRRRKSRRANPISRIRRAARRRNPVAALARRSVRRRRNPAHKMARMRMGRMGAMRRMRRRNPSFRAGFGNLGGQVMQAATGAVGALAVDAVMGQVNNFLPDAMKTQYVYPMVKLGAAVGLGIVASKVLPRHGAIMAMGSMTVTLRDFMRSFLPYGIPMGRVGNAGYVGAGYVPGSGTMATQLNQPGVGMRGRVGEYVGAEMSGLGMYAYR